LALSQKAHIAKYYCSKAANNNSIQTYVWVSILLM